MPLEWITFNDAEISRESYLQQVLERYLDRMEALVLHENLRASKPDSDIRLVARVRTATAFRSLDPKRIEQIVRFLRESRLVDVIDLSDLLFTHCDFSQVNFKGMDLSRADFFYSTLSSASFVEATLRETVFRKTKGRVVWFKAADLTGADFREANLPDASFSGADLTGVKFDEASLPRASFWNANVRDAEFSFADLRGANFTGVDLRGANAWQPYYDDTTTWPSGFDPKSIGAKFVDKDDHSLDIPLS